MSGTTGNDSLTGTDLNNTINGGGGNDTILGLGGNDALNGDGILSPGPTGTDGNDYVDGGTGNDSLLGEDRRAGWSRTMRGRGKSTTGLASRVEDTVASGREASAW